MYIDSKKYYTNNNPSFKFKLYFIWTFQNAHQKQNKNQTVIFFPRILVFSFTISEHIVHTPNQDLHNLAHETPSRQN